jgi:hypothetical protein
MKRRRLGLVSVVPLALIGTSVRGQDAECERCLTFTPVVELRTVDVRLVPSLSQSVVRIPDGRFLVSHLFSGDPRFAVYDREGEFLQLYGTAGRGPNEFRTAPKLYRGPGGTVWALEPERVVRLDSRLRHLETKRLEATIFGEAAVVLEDGIMVATRRVRSPNGAFFSVSLSAAGRETQREKARAVLEGFLEEVGWHPEVRAVVPGTLAYGQYGPMKRFVMRLIARRAGGATDTSRDHEYTDWEGVTRFTEAFLERLEG